MDIRRDGELVNEAQLLSRCLIARSLFYLDRLIG